MYFSLIYPYLLFGIEIYANSDKYILKNLIVLNNKILRILQKQPYETHTKDLYTNYNTLPIPQLHIYQLLVLVHKFVFHVNKLPPAFSDYFTLNSTVHNYDTRRKNDLYLQGLHTSKGKRMVKFKV